MEKWVAGGRGCSGVSEIDFYNALYLIFFFSFLFEYECMSENVSMNAL